MLKVLIGGFDNYNNLYKRLGYGKKRQYFLNNGNLIICGKLTFNFFINIIVNNLNLITLKRLITFLKKYYRKYYFLRISFEIFYNILNQFFIKRIIF